MYLLVSQQFIRRPRRVRVPSVKEFPMVQFLCTLVVSAVSMTAPGVLGTVGGACSCADCACACCDSGACGKDCCEQACCCDAGGCPEQDCCNESCSGGECCAKQ